MTVVYPAPELVREDRVLKACADIYSLGVVGYEMLTGRFALRGPGPVAEQNADPERPVGTIPVDSLFSPTVKVNYTVENTRVGQRTDYDRLIMEIHTDATISPEDALSYAAKILKDHMQLFITIEEEFEAERVEEVDEETLRIRQLLDMRVDELELSVRSSNCLRAANIQNLRDLVQRSESEMLKYRNFGRKSLTELNAILSELGLSFGMDVTKYEEPVTEEV